VQSAIRYAELSQVKVIVSMGGPINKNIPQFRVPGPRLILGKRPPPTGKAERVIRAYLKSIKPNTVRTSGDVVEMWDLLTCVLQQAYLARWLTPYGNEELDVMKAVDKAASMPPGKSISGELPLYSAASHRSGLRSALLIQLVWLIHGEQDSCVSRS